MHPILAIRAFFAALFGRSATPTVPRLSPETPAPSPSAPLAKTKASNVAASEVGAVQTLSLLQREGRLLDFLLEDIDGHRDADIGAAVREVHRGCRKALKDHFEMESVNKAEEESQVTVPAGYDPAEFRLVGQVVGKGPFTGTLKHQGYQTKSVRLPAAPKSERGRKVVAPAEVEIG